MKYLLILNLLFISSACSGMGWLKTLKKKVEITFSSNEPADEKIAQKTAQKDPASFSGTLDNLHSSLSETHDNVKKERLCEYQRAQRQNVTGVIFPLLWAGVFKFNVINLTQSEMRALIIIWQRLSH